MSEPIVNPYHRILLVGGPLAVVVGIAIALMARQAAESAAFRANLDGAAMGYVWDIEPNYTGSWIGIAIAVLGVVMLLIYVSQRAATYRAPKASAPE